MIKPLLQDDAFLADVTRCHNDVGVRVWWLGQSGYLIQNDGQHALIDPYLSDSLTMKYASTDKPHVRMTERVIAPESLNFIDVVTSSHNHADHLDADTLKPLIAINPDIQIIVSEANRLFAADRLGVSADRLIGLTQTQPYTRPPFTFHAVPAAHNEIERDAAGHCRCIGLIIHVGGQRIYHSGDTMWYDGIVDALLPYQIDLAILPINGYRPERRVAGNLFGDQAAELARQIGARVVTPCHYDMFTFNTEPPTLFEQRCRELDQPFQTLRAGERLQLS